MRGVSQEEKEVFEAAMEGNNGANHEPLFVATKVVAGTEYRFLCRSSLPGRDEAYPSWVMIFRPLPGKGEPRVTEIVRI